MDALIRNICYRVRGVFDESAFAVVSTLTMALGIGVCAVIFSIANAMLLRQLPYPKPDRLVVMRPITPNGRRTNLCDAHFDRDVEVTYE